MISQNDQGGLPILQVNYVRSMLMARSIRYMDVDLRAILEKGKLICLVEPVDRKVFQSRSTNNKGCASVYTARGTNDYSVISGTAGLLDRQAGDGWSTKSL